MKKIILVLITLVLFLACSKDQKQSLRLAASPWIGYSPIFYAEEQGWLKEANIKLIYSTSLNETVHYFQADLVDAFLSTQYEASLIKRKKISHLLAIDRSNGGDMVLSNKTLNELKKSDTITVYMEINSVNKILFDSFVKKHSFDITKFDIINMSQSEIKDIKPNIKDDIVIVTYKPYDIPLVKSGFLNIYSTKNSDTLVLDSLYMNENFFKNHPNRAKEIESIINRSYVQLQKDPKTYYEVIKTYIENPTYEEFEESLSGIKWLIDRPKPELNKIFIRNSILPLKDE